MGILRADDRLIHLTAEVVVAHVSNNQVAISDIGRLIAEVHSAFLSVGDDNPSASALPIPPVSIKASVNPDFIVCFEDGKKMKTLKRHLMAHFNLTPDEYRAKWGLDPSYPMVAPNYAAKRKALAIASGFGTKPAGKASSASKAAPLTTKNRAKLLE